MADPKTAALWIPQGVLGVDKGLYPQDNQNSNYYPQYDEQSTFHR